MQWEVVIGLETHAQLNTVSKIFSGAATAFGAEPNVQACAVDIALPGVLPVMNKGAVERAIRFGLAIGAKVAPKSVFARKNYFYPDLPKGYQISQYELPVVVGGTITVQVGSGDKACEKTINLTRAHLEEDAGKSLHEDFQGQSGIDLNRAGTPLLEIVTEPDMRSAAEAVAYAKKLHRLVRWIDICDGNMQEGSFRCDANVSVRPKGQAEFGTRAEIKNLNSFRFLEEAINYEVRRQIELIEDGGKVVQETRLYDPDKKETRSMRSKEDAHDYRYFPDPDLLPLIISDDWKETVKEEMPELPDRMTERFISQYTLSLYDARMLTESRATAAYYELVVAKLSSIPDFVVLTKKLIPADEQSWASEGAKSDVVRTQAYKEAANWVLGGINTYLNAKNSNDLELCLLQCPVSAQKLAWLILRILDGTISRKIGREVFDEMWHLLGGQNQNPNPTLSSREDLCDEIIRNKGLKQITDTGAIEKLIDDVLAANQKSVDEFRSGKEKAFNALVGQCMKATKGKANPQTVNELLRKKLTA